MSQREGINKIQHQIEVPITLAGERLDRIAAQLFSDYSRSQLQSWIKAGQLTVNQQPKRPRDKLAGGEIIRIAAELQAVDDWQAEAIRLNIVYEDNDIIVINKPAGLVVHPAAGHYSGTLVNALLHHCQQLETLPRAGIIHRIDKDTTGLLVVAKHLQAQTYLVRQLQQRAIHREYLAIINGVMLTGGSIQEPIGRHPRQRVKMAVVAAGKDAVTHYRVLERFRAHSSIQVILETGRTHQIRVHMAYLGHPLVGDKTYGARQLLPPQAAETLKQQLQQFKRQALHAACLQLQHPVTEKLLNFTVPLPQDMQHLLVALQKDKSKKNNL